MDGGRGRNDHYGGGGGGGRSYGGGGRHRHNNHRDGGGGRGGGRGGRGGRSRHQPYGGGGGRSRGRGGGDNRGGNRFHQGNTGYVDPQTQMIRQVYSFVSRVGELKNIRAPSTEGFRAVEATTAQNINDVVTVLCSQEKQDMLFKYSPASEGATETSSKPEEEVGKLVHLLISCVGALPLQTPCYAAFTLAVHEEVKGGQFDGFCSRCVHYTMRHVGRDLDMILLQGSSLAHGTTRLKLLLRYLAIMGRIGVVKGFDANGSSDPSKLTVVGLLETLVEAALAAAEQHNNVTAAALLSILVLSTIPYIMEYTPNEIIQEKLVQPLQSMLQAYKSTFVPGIGSTAILLKEEQLEDDDEEDDDEDDDDDGDEGAGQVCDSLQDLLRATQRLKSEGETTRFALPNDAPWKGLTRRPQPTAEGEPGEPQPIVFAEEPMYLTFSPESQALTFLVGGEGDFKLQCYNLEGVVFGRLPIFGSPPDPDDEDDEEDAEKGANKNENLQAFAKGFGLLDRYFVADALRDCLISHESRVAPTGLLRGSAKHVAEELLSICYVFSGETPEMGVEYAILETVLGLIAQSTETGSVRHIFLSRVLLELTRLQPAKLSPAMVVGTTNLFNDYLPALVPRARDNFSRWFSFHLINTDYQWPTALWKVWEPYAASDKTTSRGAFVKRTVTLMAENLTNPETLLSECLSGVDTLGNHLLGVSDTPAISEDGPSADLQREIQTRMWDANEDPALLLEYLTGDEVASSITVDYGDINQIWWRTGVAIRVAMDPARQEHTRIKLSMERAKNPDEDIMDDDGATSKDVFSTLTDAVARYKEVLSGSILKDAQSLSEHLGGSKSDSELIQMGEAYLLQQMESVTSFSRSLLEGCVDCLIMNKAVSGLGIVRWSLGDLGEGTESAVTARWWVYATIAARGCALIILESDKAGEGDIGMVIDTGADEGAAAQTKANAALKQLDPMLQYAVTRVCQILAAQGETDQKKKLSPAQVDLVEGVKNFTSSSYTFMQSMLVQGEKMGKAFANDEIQDMLAKSETSGPKLAFICSAYGGNIAVDLLQRSLECM